MAIVACNCCDSHTPCFESLTEGVVNNGDPAAKNGVYTVRCYESSDLVSWNKLSDIVSYQNNIEDGDMFERDGVLYYTFEKEVYDKGPSSLSVISSTDDGKTWSKEKEIISLGADNELASVLETEDGYVLYYSSDVNDIGKSYNGANIYKANFSKDFAEMHAEALVDVEEEQGILLYDVQQVGEELYFLYVQNYITDNNLILKKVH